MVALARVAVYAWGLRRMVRLLLLVALRRVGTSTLRVERVEVVKAAAVLGQCLGWAGHP
jgi:hypothetical protein